MTEKSDLSLIARAKTVQKRIAIVDPGRNYTYGDLLDASARVAAKLLDGRSDLSGERVAFLIPSSFDYVAVQWGIWRAGGIAVPLCTMHPPGELAYVIEDSDASIVVASPEFEARLQPLAAEQKRRFLSAREALCGEPVSLPRISGNRPALLIYTSGTTSKPKGALSTHSIIEAQVSSLIKAWGWSKEDRILLVLPLHHVHGIVNVLCCAMWAGAVCEMARSFDAEAVWRRLRDGGLTLFMAVPTIYVRLVKAWENAPTAEREAMTAACRSLRLMVCGSAPLPVSTLEEWNRISGHTLLERYGMTEIGMALSNPLHGERLAGHVGSPLPGVEIRLVDEDQCLVPDGSPGEIQVRGGNVFQEYWRKPEATAKAFVDGWFCTGDIAIRENNVYRILGRSSVDIIKTGGFKVSALEIEEELRLHPAIDQCVVVGVEDPDWGECVSTAIVLKPGATLDLPSLRSWAKERLAVYKVPGRLLLLEELPRNAMGKVTKPSLVTLFKEEAATPKPSIS